MRSNPSLSRVAAPSFFRAASIAGACALLASCERKPTEPYIPPEPQPRQPVVIAVSAPDSLAAGAALDVIVHYFGGCLIESPTTTAWSQDTLTVMPWVKVQQDCGIDGGWYVWPYPYCAMTRARVDAAPARSIPVRVLTAFGDTPRTTTVQGGVAPRARGFVQRIEVVRRDGALVPGASITVTLNHAPWDTLAAAVTDASGRAELVIDAPGVSIDVNEFVTTSGAGSEQAYQSQTLSRDHPLKTRILDRP